MNKEEKKYILQQLINYKSICNFGRKNLSMAKINKIHNDFIYQPRYFKFDIKKQDFINKVDFIFNLKDKTIYDDLYVISVKTFKQKLKGNPYLKKTYDSFDFIILKNKYNKYTDDKLKQLLIASYTICTIIGEYTIEQ